MGTSVKGRCSPIRAIIRNAAATLLLQKSIPAVQVLWLRCRTKGNRIAVVAE